MAEQMRPASKEQAPDPSFNYERSHPGRESAGKVTAPQPPPAKTPDKIADAVTNKQDGTRQINGDDADKPPQPDHSMLEEEPLGWDQAPGDPATKRHPRTGGQGGTPEPGQADSAG